MSVPNSMYAAWLCRRIEVGKTVLIGDDGTLVKVLAFCTNLNNSAVFARGVTSDGLMGDICHAHKWRIYSGGKWPKPFVEKRYSFSN